MYKRTTKALAAAARTATAAAVLLAAAACSASGTDRDYAVPADVCGVRVGPDLLKPLLPGGEKLSQKSYDAGAGSPRCRVLVDGQLVLYVSGDVVTRDTDPIKVNAHGLQAMGNPASVSVGDAARLADNGALAVADCTFQGQQQRFVTLFQLSRDVPEDVSARRAALRSLLSAYLPGAMDKQACVRGNSG